MRISAGIITASIAMAGIAAMATPATADPTFPDPVATINPWEASGFPRQPVTINPWEASGFCLTAGSSTTTNGAISLLPCTDAPTQRWYLNPTGENTVTIENAASHLVLERVGTKLQQSEPVASNANQVWQHSDNQIAGVTLDGQAQQWTVVPA